MNTLNRLDIRQLRTLFYLLRERNLSQVAKQLGVTQQAVSDQLRKLRDTFDDRLFVRSGNGVVPTPFAEALQPKLFNAIKALEQLTEPHQFDPATTHATFTISCTDLEQKTLLPMLLQLVRQQAPFLKVAVKKLELDRLASDLLNGDVDLVITNPDFAPPNYPASLLYQEKYVCVASKSNKKVKPEMSVAEVSRIPQLVVSPSRGDFSGSVQQWFHERGHPRNVMISVPTFTAAKATIASTDLCGFIPSTLLPDEDLKVIQLDCDAPGFDVISVWHQRSSYDPLHSWIRNNLADQAVK